MARQSKKKIRNISRKIGKQNRKHSKKHVKKHLKRRKTNKHRGGGSYETDLKCVMDFEPKRFIGSNRLACSIDVWRKKNNVLFVMIGKEFNEDKWTNIKELLDVIIGQLYFSASKLTSGTHEIPKDVITMLEEKQLVKISDVLTEYSKQLGSTFKLGENREEVNQDIFNKIVFIYESEQIDQKIKEWLIEHNSLIKGSNSKTLLPEIEIVKKGEILEKSTLEKSTLEKSTGKKWEWPAKPDVERNNWKSNNFFVCGNNSMIEEFLNNDNENSMIKPLQRKQEITKRSGWRGDRNFEWLRKGIVTYNIYILTDYLENQEELSSFQNSNVHGLKIKNIAKLKEQQDTDIDKIREGPGVSFRQAVENLKQLYKELYKAYTNPAPPPKPATEAAELKAAEAKRKEEEKAAAEAIAAAEFKAAAQAKAAELKNLEIELQNQHPDIFNELSNKGNTDITIFFIKLHNIEMREKKAKKEKKLEKHTTVNLDGERFKITSFYATPMFSSPEEREKVWKTSIPDPNEEPITGIRLVQCAIDDCEYITYKKFLDAGSDLQLLEGQANRKLFESYTNLWKD